jgi:hypothetical protein
VDAVRRQAVPRDGTVRLPTGLLADATLGIRDALVTRTALRPEAAILTATGAVGQETRGSRLAVETWLILAQLILAQLILARLTGAESVGQTVMRLCPWLAHRAGQPPAVGGTATLVEAGRLLLARLARLAPLVLAELPLLAALVLADLRMLAAPVLAELPLLAALVLPDKTVLAKATGIGATRQLAAESIWVLVGLSLPWQSLPWFCQPWPGRLRLADRRLCYRGLCHRGLCHRGLCHRGLCRRDLCHRGLRH